MSLKLTMENESLSHIQDHIGQALTKASVGLGSTTTFLGFKGWIEQNSVIIGFSLTLVFGAIGVCIQWKNYKLNQRRVIAMEERAKRDEEP
ncbi:hypothetical protein A3765_28435 [Oleiphilus sp. HI0130]|nr:hypothetical protein A3765_29915 [Oleiphilus sp. HI0130]KZZ72480.1 hypothetical protein A3765_28435 [Oleiphilus sp. HI0130]